jgi:uncharacterized protein (UPF0333 family)
MEEKAQGALEYLLLIGGAVLVAAVVLSLLASMTPSVQHATDNKLQHFLGEI